MEYPKRLETVHQIELTNHCNLKCVYCMQPKQEREKVFMSEEIFHKSIAIVKECLEKRKQGSVWLHGLGEPLLHPMLEEFLAYARKELPTVKLLMSSNALLITEDMCLMLKNYGIVLHISVHKPEKAMKGIQLAIKHKIVEDISSNAAIRPNDWAGQLDWAHSPDVFPCAWLREGCGYIMSDGNIVNCCTDVLATNILGTVDDWRDILIAPYQLCENCNQTP